MMLLKLVLLVPLLLLSAGMFLVALSFYPWYAVLGAFVLLGMVAWFWVRRRRSGSGAVSEMSLMGRQSSKGGLL
jgi:LPXTG-motif cell wall-anchored protein